MFSQENPEKSLHFIKKIFFIEGIKYCKRLIACDYLIILKALEKTYPHSLFITAAQFLHFTSLVTPLEDILIPLSKYSNTNVLCLSFSDIVKKKGGKIFQKS